MLRAYSIAFSVATTGLCNNAIPTQIGIGTFTINDLIPVCTTANGGILSFKVFVATGPLISNPSPTMVFDAFDSMNLAGNNLSFTVSSQTLNGGSPGSQWFLLENLVSGSGLCSYPQLAILEANEVVANGSVVPVTINPEEGVFGSGTYDVTGGVPAGGSGGSDTGYGWFFFQNIAVHRVLLPDPKICKTERQLTNPKIRFQKDFTICE